MLGAQQLGHVALGSGVGAHQGPLCAAEVQRPERVRLGEELADSCLRAGDVDAAFAPRAHGSDSDGEAVAAADRDPLVPKRGPRDHPPGIDVPDDIVVRHENLVQEHLVEHGAAGRFPERANVYPLCLHVDDHCRDACVLRRVPVGPDRR